MSTVSPGLSRWLAERHGAAGQTLVAAPVFGRPDAAEAGKLWIVAAGPGGAIERCRPLLEAMGQGGIRAGGDRSEEHTSELPSPFKFVCRLLLGKKKKTETKLWNA